MKLIKMSTGKMTQKAGDNCKIVKVIINREKNTVSM